MQNVIIVSLLILISINLIRKVVKNKKKKMKNNLWKCKSWWGAYYVTSENMKC